MTVFNLKKQDKFTLFGESEEREVAYFLAIVLSYVYYYLTKDKEGLIHFRSEILW